MPPLRMSTARTPTLTISGSPPLTGTVGSAYAGFTPTTSGGSGGNTFSMVGTALPAGLTMDSSTGAVSGTPTGAGTISGIIQRVTDNFGHTANLSWGDVVVSSSSYDDGSSVAKSGPAQYPHALDLSSGTNEFGVSMTLRTPWNVVGVDYRAGPSSTQVFKTLPADAASLPANVGYDSAAVYINSSSPNTVLDGWDFGGRTIKNYSGNAATLTVRNSTWTAVSPGGCFYTDNAVNTGLITIEFCYLDQAAMSNSAGDFINRVVGGTTRTYIHHCILLNGEADAINNTYGFDDMRIMYNVMRDFCWNGANHTDAWQEVTPYAVSALSGLVFRGNLIIQSAANPVTHLPGFWNSILSHGDSNTANTMYNTYMDHNTLIGIGITGHDSPGGYVGVPAFGCILQGFGLSPEGKTNGLYVNNNYVYTDYNAADPTLQGFYSGPWKIQKIASANISNVSINTNYQMRDGSALETVTI